MLTFLTPAPKEMLDACYRLRYQAYCIDNDFEPQNDTGLEIDSDDAHADHCLAMIDGVPVGCARLIYHQENVAELSRFCISKTATQKNEIRSGLIRGLIDMSLRAEVDYWFAIMEPWFIKSIRSSKIYFNVIGPELEYRGIRRACYMKVPYNWNCS